MPHLVLGRSERQPRSPRTRWPRAPHARARRLCRRCIWRPAHRARASLRTRGRGRAGGQMNWLRSRYPVKGRLLRLVHAHLPPPCAHCRHKSRGRREIWAMVLGWAAQRKRNGNDPGSCCTAISCSRDWTSNVNSSRELIQEVRRDRYGALESADGEREAPGGPGCALCADAARPHRCDGVLWVAVCRACAGSGV